MTIPDLTDDGVLPAGVHECSLNDLKARFGRFNKSDRRVQLTAQLVEYFESLRQTGLVSWVAIDGSYVTSKPDPGDIDLIVVLKADHDFSSTLRPDFYNALSKKRVRNKYTFDVFVAPEDSLALSDSLEFFQKTRGGTPKGILRVQL